MHTGFASPYVTSAVDLFDRTVEAKRSRGLNRDLAQGSIYEARRHARLWENAKCSPLASIHRARAVMAVALDAMKISFSTTESEPAGATPVTNSDPTARTSDTVAARAVQRICRGARRGDDSTSKGADSR